MASYHEHAENLKEGDFIYDKSFTVTDITVLEGTGVIANGTRNGTGKDETHTFESAVPVWIHRTNHSFV